MTPEAFAALGARLLLMRRCHLTVAQVAALPDDAALAIASGLLDADEAVRAAAYGGGR